MQLKRIEKLICCIIGVEFASSLSRLLLRMCLFEFNAINDTLLSM